MASYRKHRPSTFEDVIGQPHITQTLKNEVASGHTAHAYLFTGPRGTGKTTCSKILAMAVNCENPNDGDPCLVCESCKSIADGATLDVVEIDAASNNGVDNIRDLRDEASYTPAQCKYRVYIIDEAHMLSSGAFNALLKIMEEPPPHVKFILATTEAHKVPATILSRCQRFDFHRIKSEAIKERLLSAVRGESFTLSDDAASLIARLADGGMRDAYSILDQCVAFSDNVDLTCVASAAGVVGHEYLFELTDCLVENDPSKAILLIGELYAMSKDLRGLLEEFIHHLRNIMLSLTLKDPGEFIAVLPDEMKRIKDYTLKLPLATLLSSISLLQECLDKMGRGTDIRLTLELYLIRLCTPSLNETNDGIISRLERLENTVSRLRSGEAIAGSPASSPAPATTPIPIPAPAPAPNMVIDDAKLTQQQVAVEPAAEQQAAPIVTIAHEKPVALQSGETEFAPLNEWADILEALFTANPPLFGVLENSRAVTRNEYLYIDTQSVIAGTLMKQEGNASKLLALVEDKTGVRYKIRMKTSVKNVEEQALASPSPLDDILQKAKLNGIPVKEE